jgi:hypothetical protein
MKLDRTTAVLATLALCSIGFAQRAFGQSTVNCSNPQIGTDVLLGTTAASSACQVSNTVQVTLGKYARLSIDNTTTNLTVPQASDFGTAAGVNTTGPNLTVSSNAPWTLTASTAASWTGSGNNSKPLSDIKGKADGGSFTAFPFTAATGNAIASDPHTTAYNTIYSFVTDTPGSYSLVVNYTLSAP